MHAMVYMCVYVCVHKHTRFQFQNQGLELNLFTFRMLGMASGSMVETHGAAPIDCSDPTGWV